MTTETVYLEHDNTIDLLLKADGTAQDLSDVTKITASFDDTLITSTDKANGVITWDQASYDTGEIRLNLGDQDISVGIYRVPIIVYDATNTDGIVWGYVEIIIIGDVEAT